MLEQKYNGLLLRDRTQCWLHLSTKDILSTKIRPYYEVDHRCLGPDISNAEFCWDEREIEIHQQPSTNINITTKQHVDFVADSLRMLVYELYSGL